MNPVAAFPDDPADPVEAVVRGIVGLERASRDEAGANDGENYRVEERLVFFVEQAIDENKAVEAAI